MSKRLDKLLQVGRDNPKLRAIFVVGIAVVLVFIVWSIIKADRSDSEVGGASQIQAPSFSGPSSESSTVSAQYRQAQQAADYQNQQAALMNGTDFIAAPMNNTPGVASAAAALMAQTPGLGKRSANALAQAEKDLKDHRMTEAQFAARVANIEAKSHSFSRAQAAQFLERAGVNPALLNSPEVASTPVDSTKQYVESLAKSPVLQDANGLVSLAEAPGTTEGQVLDQLADNPGFKNLSLAQQQAIKQQVGAAFATMQTACASQPSSDACATAKTALATALNTSAVSLVAAKKLDSVLKDAASAGSRSSQVLAQGLQAMVDNGDLSLAQAKDILSHNLAAQKAAAELQAMVGESTPVTEQQALVQQEETQSQQAEALQKKQQDAQEAEQLKMAEQARLAKITAAMLTQQNALVQAWAATPQQVMVAIPATGGSLGVNDLSGADLSGSSVPGQQKPLLKMGSILFAQLDTGVNSDYPDTPVMATIIDGPLKGSKLMGTLKPLPTNADRVELVFDDISIKGEDSVIPVQAVAINPNDARLAMASDVDHHYISRYGSLFAASFLQGYGQSLQQAGTVVVPTILGPEKIFTNTLSPTERIAAGLGQVGVNAGNAAMANFNRPPTVTIDAGVGIGILFRGNVLNHPPAQASAASPTVSLPAKASA